MDAQVVTRHPPLAPWVTEIAHFALTAPMPAALQPAGLTVPLIVTFGDPWRVGLGPSLAVPVRAGSFVAGLAAGPVRIAADGPTSCVQIDLTPPGLARLLGVPLSALGGGVVPLSALDAGVRDFAARLADLPNAPARLDLAQHWLAARLGAGVGDARMDAAWAALAPGRPLRIGALADHLGLSRQHFARRFTDSFGLPPRSVARIARFQRARRLAATGRATGWADLAALAGYADQPHLVREFRALGGSSPGRWPG